MKDKLILLAKHPLITGSSIIFIGSMGANILNYLFNLAMGRYLSVGDYGVFASLISLFNIFSIFSVAIMLVFSKFSAVLVGQKKENLLGSLIISGNLWVGIISLIFCGILFFLSSQISHFLNISNSLLVIITVGSLFFSFIWSVPAGILQGILKFGHFSLVNIGSSLVKLTLGVILVFAGWKVLGAITAFFLSIFASYIFAILPLYKYLKVKSKDGFTLSSLHTKAYVYAIPVFLSSIGVTSLISADIILTKHFFNSSVAGQYAALSLMGRSIFYVISPISAVLFPLIVQKKEKKEALTGTLLLAMLLIELPSIILTSIYFMFPNIILKIFFPSPQYLAVAKYLGPFSLFILMYSVSFILNSFYLSLGKTRVFLFTIVGALLEVLFIYIWHADIGQIITDLLASTFLLTIGLLVYYRHATRTS